VALELIAMRPTNPNSERKPIEYDPIKPYLRYLIYDSFVFLSGAVAPGPDLDRQLTDVLAEIDGSLADAGTSWDKITNAAYLLHRTQKVEELKGLLERKNRMGVPRTEIGFVDDFAPDAILIEVEVTAKINK
jgi:enamine deaminase RidA (YjgF/YER057c/UK114 family)